MSANRKLAIPVLGFGPDAGPAIDVERLIVTRLLIQANSGAGKSWAIRYLLEHLFGVVPQIVIDTEGEFATLREKFAYLLASAGGAGDIPARPETARLLARRLVELGCNAIVDIFDLELEDRRRFVHDFVDELMALPRELWRSTLVVLDEIQLFAPEGEEVVSRKPIRRLAGQGRKRGLCLAGATQRISRVDKDVAAELLNKLIGRTGLDIDLKRAGDDLGFDKTRRAALRHLDPGQFYAYGPAISREVVLVRTGDVQTTHPEAGKIMAAVPPAPAAIVALVGQLQGLAQEAEVEAKTVDELRVKVQFLETQLRRKESDPNGVTKAERVVEKRVEVPVVPAGFLNAVDRVLGMSSRAHIAAGEAAAAAQRAGEAADQAQLAIRDLRTIAAAAKDANHPTAPRPTAAEARPVPSRPVPAPPAPRKVTPRGVGDRPVARQRILDALATLAGLGLHAVPRGIAAVLSHQSPRSSAYGAHVTALVDEGLLRYPTPGTLGLTDHGRRQAQPAEIAPGRAALLDAWCAHVLSASQARLARVIAGAHPGSLTREELAERAGVSVKSSQFGADVTTLKTLGVAAYPATGLVGATTLLFPEGLR